MITEKTYRPLSGWLPLPINLAMLVGGPWILISGAIGLGRYGGSRDQPDSATEIGIESPRQTAKRLRLDGEDLPGPAQLGKRRLHPSCILGHRRCHP